MVSKSTYQRVFYKNNRSNLEYVEQSLDLEKENGEFKLSPTQVLIKTHAAGLNLVDILIYRMISPWMNIFKNKFGVAKDFSGVIVGVGSKVKSEHAFQINDKVCGFIDQFFNNPAFSEYILLDYEHKDFDLAKIPSNLNIVEAASFPTVFGTAFAAIEHAKIEPRSTILINGAGTSVGRYALSILKQNPNVGKIVGICSSRSEALARKLGADEIVDYTRGGSIVTDLEERINIDNKKFDIFFELAGSEVLLKNLSKFLKPDGYYVNISGGKTQDVTKDKFIGIFTWDLIKFGLKNKLGINKFKYTQVRVEANKGYLENSVKLLNKDASLKPVVDKIYRFNEAQDAFDYVASGKAFGKVLVEFSH